MPSTIYNRVRVNVTTTGTTTSLLMGAATNASVFTFAEASVANSATVTYVLEEGSNVEYGTGTYATGNTRLDGRNVIASKIAGAATTSRISLLGAAVLFIDALNQDITVPPSSATDNAVALFDGTTGRYIQDIGKVYISDTGHITVGRSAEVLIGTISTQVSTYQNVNQFGFGMQTYDAAGSGAGFYQSVSRTSTIGAHSASKQGDYPLNIYSYASDGAGYFSQGYISSRITGTVTTSIVPGEWEIGTLAPDGSGSKARMVIAHDWSRWQGGTSTKDHFFQKTVHLDSDASTGISNSIVIPAFSTTVDAGTYRFDYYVRHQSNLSTTGVKFGVFHSGGVTMLAANMRYIAGGTATLTLHNQAGSATIGQVMAGFSTRTNSTTALMGPTTAGDATAGDYLAIVEGVIVVSSVGDLRLYWASEVTATSTIKAGSTLLLTRFN